MARDDHPRARRLAKIARRDAVRGTYDRVLIVTEGEKTEPQYLLEIRSALKLHTANVQVHHSADGTNPMQVVEFAQNLFENGDPNKDVLAKRWDRVFAIFDRDDHKSYHAALDKAAALNGRLRNNLRAHVSFEAIPSVQSFELWLLMHYEDPAADHPLHRDDVLKRLQRHIPEYGKGMKGLFARTCHNLNRAYANAERLRLHNSPRHGELPFTDMDRLVKLLTGLKS